MSTVTASPDVYRVLRFSAGAAVEDPQRCSDVVGPKSFVDPQLPSPVLQRFPGHDEIAPGNNSLLAAASAADALNSLDISGSSYATVGRAATRLMPTYGNSSAVDSMLLPTNDSGASLLSSVARASYVSRIPDSRDGASKAVGLPDELDRGGEAASSTPSHQTNHTAEAGRGGGAGARDVDSRQNRSGKTSTTVGGHALPPLSLSNLLGQTRLVHAKLAHLRTDLDTLLSTITIDEPNRCRLPLLIAKGEEDIWEPPTVAQLVSSNSLLSDALDNVFRIQQSLVHTRRLLTNALELPLREQQQQQQGGPGGRSAAASRNGIHNSGSSASAATAGMLPFSMAKVSTAASIARREEMSVQFALEELRILKGELAKFGDRVSKVEAVVLLALGVRAGGSTPASAPTEQQLRVPTDADGPTPQYVVRRRADANLDDIRQQVESAMHRDAKFRPLLRKKSAEASALAVQMRGVIQSNSRPAAQTAAARFATGGQPQALKSKSAFLAEMDALEQSIAREKEEQHRVSSCGAAGEHADSGADAASVDHLQRSAVSDHTAPTDKKPSSDLVDEVSHEISSALGADVVAAVAGGAGIDAAADAPSAPHSEVDASRFLESDDAAEQSNGDGSTTRGSGEKVDEALPSVMSLSIPTAPPSVNFRERLAAWVKSFLVDSACQWIACEDEEKKTFYFHLETGERVADLGDYFADVVAEGVVRELLAAGEADGLGWTLVPPGTVDAAQQTEYYCHVASGEVTWSLLQWVKEH